MAAIDKTYVNKYSEYLEIKEWCEGKSFTLSNGDVIYPSDFLYDVSNVDWKKIEEEGGEYPIWNTPGYMDMWLFKNCPLKIIQDRLKEQYFDVEKVYNEYISFKRPESGTHYKITRKKRFKNRRNFHVEIEDMVYNEEHDTWYYYQELLPWTSNLTYVWNVKPRKLSRMIKKWKLPKGTKVLFYTYRDSFEITIK